MSLSQGSLEFVANLSYIRYILKGKKKNCVELQYGSTLNVASEVDLKEIVVDRLWKCVVFVNL